MKENKVKIEVIEIVVDDGEIFKLDSERLSNDKIKSRIDGIK